MIVFTSVVALSPLKNTHVLSRLCGLAAEWLGSRTCDQQVAGSNPGRRTAECNPGQVVYIRASVTKQYNLVPANGRWCSTSGEVTAGLAESNGSLPPGLWLRSPAGWLTRTGINSGTLRSFWSMGLHLLHLACSIFRYACPGRLRDCVMLISRDPLGLSRRLPFADTSDIAVPRTRIKICDCEWSLSSNE